MTRYRFKSAQELSVASIFAKARQFDWQELSEQDRVRVVLPEPTKRDLADYGVKNREEWEDSDARCEWENGFFPIMNAAWPVELAYGVSEDEAANLMNRYSGATTLVAVSDEDGEESYFIGMSGGGMDLSWDLCAAFICCGCIPPITILQGLPNMATGRRYASTVSDPMAVRILAAMKPTKQYLRRVASSLDRTRASVTNKR